MKPLAFPPLGALVVAMRPSHWVKNSFVVAPAVFGLKLYAPSSWGPLILAVAAFSLAASAGYLVNDVLDREEDRANPRTASRPLATGQLSPGLALVAAFGVAGVALILAWWGSCLVPVLAYLALGHAYSVYGKHVPFLDVATLTGLYLLRLLGGAQAVAVPASPWLLLCGGSLALLLALAKRLERPGPLYKPSFLRPAVGALAVVVTLCYAVYAVRPATWHTFSPAFTLTLVPVILAMERFWHLVRQGQTDPMGGLLADPPLTMAVLLWVVLVLAFSYFAKS
ncbi:MAG: UbiA family prenyltransferase [Thermoanaerobaculaceae bacterium]